MWNNLYKPTPAEHTTPLQPPPNSSILEFDSRFESGNLLQAYQCKDNRVHLILQNDTNTFGYNQWFYFKARCKSGHLTARLEIINMRKSYSLHRQGMKIAVFNELLFRENGKDWHRGGTNIEYSSNGTGLFTLGWDYTF